MLIFALNAGGYYTVGTAVVAAHSLNQACELANKASDKKLDLTYHGIINKDPIGICPTTKPQVLNIHEWGMPNLPSKGSGLKVTF